MSEALTEKIAREIEQSALGYQEARGNKSVFDHDEILGESAEDLRRMFSDDAKRIIKMIRAQEAPKRIWAYQPSRKVGYIRADIIERIKETELESKINRARGELEYHLRMMRRYVWAATSLAAASIVLSILALIIK